MHGPPRCGQARGRTRGAFGRARSVDAVVRSHVVESAFRGLRGSAAHGLRSFEPANRTTRGEPPSSCPRSPLAPPSRRRSIHTSWHCSGCAALAVFGGRGRIGPAPRRTPRASTSTASPAAQNCAEPARSGCDPAQTFRGVRACRGAAFGRARSVARSVRSSRVSERRSVERARSLEPCVRASNLCNALGRSSRPSVEGGARSVARAVRRSRAALDGSSRVSEPSRPFGIRSPRAHGKIVRVAT